MFSLYASERELSPLLLLRRFLREHVFPSGAVFGDLLAAVDGRFLAGHLPAAALVSLDLLFRPGEETSLLTLLRDRRESETFLEGTLSLAGQELSVRLFR